MRYIGSKNRLLRFIEKHITELCGDEDFIFGDLFSGTAAVSKHFKKLGHEIIANDNLAFCSIFAKAALFINDEPKFSTLFEKDGVDKQPINKLVVKPYDRVLSYLNRLSGIPGFMYKEYTPEGSQDQEHQRRYFSENNAQKIDTIREKIEEWDRKGLLSESESALLISDLLISANKVANIAGTYGYFLKDWDPRTFHDLTLSRSPIIKSNKPHTVYNEDANELVKRISCDVLYFDPPYTWRHYGAYYHILETIALWDKPQVLGKSGLRDWEESRSRYCMRDEATIALNDLIQNSKADHIFLSYNSEGLASHEEIIDSLSQQGTPEFYEKPYRRYKSNNGGSGKNVVAERLYYVKGKR